MPVRLRPIDGSNWRESLAVEVTAEQLRFVADHQPVALVMLAKAYVRPGGFDWWPLSIHREADGALVGVGELVVGAPSLRLVHLAIDRRPGD